MAALAASCAALLVTAAPAAADTTCSIPASAPVLSTFGDQANYTLLPGGSFENGAPGWSLNNASVVEGNEPWQVGGSSDSSSLTIQPGGSAIAASGCATNLFPTFRFFAKSTPGAPASQLHVGVRWTTSWGLSGYTTLGNLDSGTYTSWQPTQSLPLGSLIPSGMTVYGRIVFTADPNGGAWNVDDVYVDPYAR